MIAISARTPFEAPLRFTVSMNGPGNVFSRPMRRPTTFSALICLFSYVPIHHVLPVGPIVRPAVPDIEFGGHTLLLQHAREALRFVDVRIIPARRDDDLRRPERREIAIVVEVREKSEWIHEIRLAAPVAVQPTRRVVCAGHPDGLARDAWAPRHERERVKRPERASGDDQLIDSVREPDRRQDLVDKVPLVREMAASAILRRGRLVVEGLAVDRV